MHFPLYESLLNEIPKKDLTAKQKSDLVSMISKMDSYGKELMYVIINIYMKNEDDTNDEVPYKGVKFTDPNGISSISWKLSEIPVKLRHILYKFVSMHMRKMEEDNIRSKNSMIL